MVGIQVETRFITKNRYGLTVVELSLAVPDITGRTVQSEMVARGHAVVGQAKSVVSS